MTNVFAISGTSISSQPQERPVVVPASDSGLGFLSGDAQTYAVNLIKDWHAQLVFLDGLKGKSAGNHRDNLFQLINHAGVAPWELRPVHLTRYFESRQADRGGKALAPATVGVKCSAWRSFQNFMLDLERVNEISRQFGVRPVKFVNEENSIAVKRHKANWKNKSWSLSTRQIEEIDEEFKVAIRRAAATNSKSLLPLQRDRVMFHIAIHFALRISELVTAQTTDFRASHDPTMAHFGNLGVLTVTGKGDVTGSIPMREPMVHSLLTWYLETVRPKLLLRRRDSGDGTCTFNDNTYRVGELLFPSERGGIVEPNQFRKRLKQMAMAAGTIQKRLTPHTLRHTGCTLMVPIYSPEIAQKYMRHKNLFTTLGYYHPTPLQAGNEVNAAVSLFDDEEDEG